jgi:hypothetical protein
VSREMRMMILPVFGYYEKYQKIYECLRSGG